MTNEKILDRLIEINSKESKECKERIDYCLKKVNKLKEWRPVLSKCIFYNGLQVFTDSCFLVMLCRDDALPIEEINEKKGESYPNVSFLFNLEAFTNDLTIKINVGKMINFLKAYKVGGLHTKYGDVYLAYEGFKNFIEFMNLKSKDDIELHLACDNESCTEKPLSVIKENGTKGIIVPCRMCVDPHFYGEI